MKNEILLELASKWEKEAGKSDVSAAEDATKEALEMARINGRIVQLYTCAEELRKLVEILG